MHKNKVLIILAAVMLLLLHATAYADSQTIPVTFGTVTETEESEYVSVKIEKVYSGRGDAEKHTAAAIDEDSALWMWGDNSYGKCLTDGESAAEPTKVMDNVKQAAIGEGHTAVLKNDGTLWTWGKNNHGQLGTGEISNYGEPTQIMSDVIKIAAGADFTLALKSNGDLYGFGRNRESAFSVVGVGRLESPQLLLSGVRDMTAGDEWSFIITNNDYLYVIGLNYHGQLGDGTYQKNKRYLKIMENVKCVSAGSDCTLIVTKTGDLYGCGKNFYGQLGDDILGATVPVKIMSDVTDAFCGEYFSLILKNDGTLSRLGGKTVGFINNTASELSVLEGGIKSVSETGIPLALDLNGDVYFLSDDSMTAVDIKTPAEKITEIKYIFSESGTITAYVSGKKEFSGGTAILAFYNEKKLVATSVNDVEKVGDALTFTPPADSDCCRIFLFENKTTNKPIAEHKELNLSPNINMEATAARAVADGYDITYNVTVSVSLNSLEFSEKPITFVMVPDTVQEADLYDALYIYQGVTETDGSMQLTFPVHSELSNVKLRASAGGVYLGECYVYEIENEGTE